MGDRYVHRLFTGHRGGGKTTELKWVAEQLRTDPKGPQYFVSLLDVDDTIDLDDPDPTDLALAIVRRLVTDLKKGEKVGAVKRRPRRGIEALAISIKIGDRFGQAWSLQGLAEINRLQGRYDEADEQHRRAETLFCQLGTAADTAAAEATAELAEW